MHCCLAAGVFVGGAISSAVTSRSGSPASSSFTSSTWGTEAPSPGCLLWASAWDQSQHRSCAVLLSSMPWCDQVKSLFAANTKPDFVSFVFELYLKLANIEAYCFLSLPNPSFRFFSTYCTSKHEMCALWVLLSVASSLQPQAEGQIDVKARTSEKE